MTDRELKVKEGRLLLPGDIIVGEFIEPNIFFAWGEHKEVERSYWTNDGPCIEFVGRTDRPWWSHKKVFKVIPSKFTLKHIPNGDGVKKIWLDEEYMRDYADGKHGYDSSHNLVCLYAEEIIKLRDKVEKLESIELEEIRAEAAVRERYRWIAWMQAKFGWQKSVDYTSDFYLWVDDAERV